MGISRKTDFGEFRELWINFWTEEGINGLGSNKFRNFWTEEGINGLGSADFWKNQKFWRRTKIKFL